MGAKGDHAGTGIPKGGNTQRSMDGWIDRSIDLDRWSLGQRTEPEQHDRRDDIAELGFTVAEAVPSPLDVHRHKVLREGRTTAGAAAASPSGAAAASPSGSHGYTAGTGTTVRLVCDSAALFSSSSSTRQDW
eukprot:SAG22_NODE_205_length_15308_cov_20.539023_7_plen_132_part_00